MSRLITFFLMATTLIYITSCGLSEDTIAKVGGQKITLEEFKQQLKQRFPGKALAEIDSSGKMQVLNRMIENQQRLSAARAMNLDKDKDLLSEVENQKKRMVYSKYYEHMIVDSLIDLQRVADYLDKIKEEIKASHVLVSFQGSRGSKNNRSKEQAETLAKQISEEAKAGADIAGLAAKHSDDPSAEKNKGDLGYFTWGRMTDAFQKAAFALNIGEVSDPVLTEFGYHIIKLEDRRPNPFYDPENLAEPTLQIKRQLYSEKREEATQMWNEHIKKLKERLNFRLENEGISKVLAITEEKRNAGQSKMEDYSEDDKKIDVAKWDGGKLTLGDLFKIYEQNFNSLHAKLTNQTALQQEVENLANLELAVSRAKKLGFDKEEEIEDSVSKLVEQRMLSMVEKKAVSDQIELEDEEMMKYYEEHKNEYVNPAEIELWEIYVTDEKLANKITKLAKSGEDFGSLAEKYTEDKVNKEKKGYLGYKDEKRRGAVSQKAFEVGENQIAGPIKYRNGWAIIKTGSLKPETLKSYEDSRSRIQSKLKGLKIKDRREEWEKEIKDKYAPKINYQLLENLP